MTSLLKSPVGIIAVVIGFLGVVGAVVTEVLTGHDPTATIGIISAILVGSGLLGSKQVSQDAKLDTIGKNVNGNLTTLLALASNAINSQASPSATPTATDNTLHEETLANVQSVINELPSHVPGADEPPAPTVPVS